jgi:hypothetical protein
VLRLKTSIVIDLRQGSMKNLISFDLHSKIAFENSGKHSVSNFSFSKIFSAFSLKSRTFLYAELITFSIGYHAFNDGINIFWLD